MDVSEFSYFSVAKLDQLKKDVVMNLERYRTGDFLDLSRDNGWNIKSDLVSVELELLSSLNNLEGTAATDFDASVIVHRSLKGMTPALAMEPRVWSRLAHVQCFNYTRNRWKLSGEDRVQSEQVLRHFFGSGRNGIRDDNAISRLWWNMHIASIADPLDPQGALRLILKTADIRQAIVERPNTASRMPLIKAILRSMQNDPWVTSTESSFRRLMVEINLSGGGVLFENHDDLMVDGFVSGCVEKARRYLEDAKIG
ncbi:DUF6339 family protein [Pseudomonas alliivorans]|nr:DUF6339 family protein [Pseudomonas alliivorans]MEE5136496.1 DUF6339 family protein [Pseudomonas alliivorans]